jgi:hypothetical protein
MAQKLMEQGQAPVTHWAQGLANLANSALGGYEYSKAGEERRAERANEIAENYKMVGLPPPAAAAEAPTGGFQKLAALLNGGGGGVPASPAVAPPPALAAPAGIPSDQAAYAPPPAAGPAPTTFRPGITAPAPAGPVDGNLPRGLRNNNPLNIEAGDFTKGQPGFVGSDGRFARFETPDQGIAAASKLLDTYESKYGLNTPAGIIGRWAPQGENNSAAYAAAVAKKLGIGPNDPITPEMRPRLIAAMSEVENGRPAAAPQIASALTAPTGDVTLPRGATPAQGALPTAAQAAAPPATNPLSRLPQETRERIAAGMSSRSPGARAMAQALLQSAISGEGVTTADAGNKIIVMDKRGNVVREMAKGEPNKGPEFGVIGKDEFGNERYGWRDPRDKSTTPAAPQGTTQPTITGSDGKPIPIAPGIDPKVIREAASKRAASEGMPASSEETSKLRNEIQGLPSYKNVAQAAPVYKSMMEAAGRDTRAADVNMIYGMAKIMDPGSVVRESEMTVAQAIATLPQQLQAAIKSQMTESGRLTPELRAQIMQEARSRITAYQGMFDQDAGMYRQIAKDQRMNEAHVLPTFGPFDEFKPATIKPPAPAVSPTQIDDLVKKYLP